MKWLARSNPLQKEISLRNPVDNDEKKTRGKTKIDSDDIVHPQVQFTIFKFIRK